MDRLFPEDRKDSGSVVILKLPLALKLTAALLENNSSHFIYLIKTSGSQMNKTTVNFSSIQLFHLTFASFFRETVCEKQIKLLNLLCIVLVKTPCTFHNPICIVNRVGIVTYAVLIKFPTV